MRSAMPIVFFVYAAILLGGGVMGSMVSGKPSSIIGSGVFALVAVVAGMVTRSNPGTGLVIGLVDALVVAAFFIYRYSSTHKAMPAFPSIALSAIVAVLAIVALSQLRQTTGR